MEQLVQPPQSAWKWWEQRRFRYNIGLVIAGITAFIAYTVLSELLTMPYDHDFEITLFTILFQGVGYLIMIGVANVFYFLGPLFDKSFNRSDSVTFRLRLFNLGFWFSVALPFIIPVIIVIQYFTVYAK